MISAPQSARQRKRALATIALLSGILAAAPGRVSAQTYPGADWAVSTPQAEGMDPVKFADAMANMPPIAIVIKNGKIIGTKGDITRPGPLYSGSKALIATMAGVLFQQGKINMDTLVPWSDQPTPPLAAMKHFLTMTSDFNLTPHSPGDHYAYSNSGAVRYGSFMIYTYYPGITEVEAMKTAFLNKLGIQDGLSMVGAISGWGGGGFIISTRDLARLGLLYLRKGVWEGERLIPEWFVDGQYLNQIPAAATAGGTGSGEYDNQVNVTPRLPGTYAWGFWIPHGRAGYEGSRSTTVASTVTGSYGTSMHFIPKYDMILAGVHTVDTMSGGRISGALIDQFAAAVLPVPKNGDTAPPNAAVTFPANNATVSGWITLTASASDNVGVKYVEWFFDGMALGSVRTSPPYAQQFNTLTVPNGAHTLGARVTDVNGNTNSAMPITITVNNGSSPPPPPPPSTTLAVTSLVLINADTDQPIAGYNPIPSGAVLNLSTLPTRNLNIQALTDPATAGSVQFTLNGSVFRVESAAPYAMAGDNSGDYNPWTPAAGSYTLTATPFSSSGASGTAGTPLTISFTVTNQASSDTTPPSISMTAPANNATVSGAVVVSANAADDVGVAGVQFLLDGNPLGAEATVAPYSITWDTTNVSGTHTLSARARDAAGNTATATPITVSIGAPPPPPASPITSLALINADTDQPVTGYDPISNGMVIQKSSLPTQDLNIVARASGGGIGSVKFTLNGATVRIENVAPYAIGGDNAGNYLPWTLPTGSLTLTATPYSGTNATGTAGTPLTVQFTVQ